MRIKSVRAYLMSCPLDPPVVLRYHHGERTILKRDAMVIRVEGDNGLVGYGPGPAHERALRQIEARVIPFLEGRELREPDALRILFGRLPGVTPEDFRYYTAVEIALFDLTAKALEVPLADLLGGRMRADIRLYGSAGMYMDPAGYAEEAAAVARAGYSAYKMRPGLGPEQDVEAVKMVREALGPDLDLMVDAHTWWRMGDRSYSEATVHELAAEMGRIGVSWLEEPLPPADHKAYGRLHDKDLVPLATGEHERDEAGYADLIGFRSVDFLQMDLVCQGGYTAGRRLLTDVQRAGLTFAFHSWGTDLEVLAAAHLGVCWPEDVALWLERPCYRTSEMEAMYPFPLAHEILKDPLPVRRGALVIEGDRPGLGIDVDMSVVERYPWKPGPWSFFRLESPAETWAVSGDHSVRWTEA
jgi:L-alanine-DL-glutamate epimerase-like enolase superfamily enzyme